MRPFDELLKESASIHGHLCAGQVLGVRMAMAGCREVDIEEPKGCKKLLVCVEMDRCATDAIQAVTGCSLGKRSLKFLDYGKMAATFVNLESQKAIRVLAKDEARSLVCVYADGDSNQREAEKRAYAIMAEEALFSIQPVRIEIPEEDIPGARSKRVFCDRCGEGINFKRETRIDGKILCIPCARGSYLARKGEPTAQDPKVLLIVGYKKTGKTTLIEKLIPELSQRGYRVGTIKHHHSRSPMEVDAPGKDSWRHRRSGAKSVVLVSPDQLAVFQDRDSATPLDDLIKYMRDVDIVLVEGFRSEPKPRIEIHGASNGAPVSPKSDDHLLAIISPEKRNGEVPCFSPDEIEPLADVIEKRILMNLFKPCLSISLYR